MILNLKFYIPLMLKGFSSYIFSVLLPCKPHLNQIHVQWQRIVSISCIFCRPLNALIRRGYNFECRCNYAFTRFIKKQIYLCLSLIVIDLATGKVSFLSVLLLTLKTTTKIRHLRRNLVEVLFSPLDSWESQGKYCVFKTKQRISTL